MCIFWLKMARKNMSKVWNYFEKIDINSWKCKTCDTILNNKSLIHKDILKVNIYVYYV